MIIQSALFCLALNIYYEANVEPVLGKYAVAHVTINRVEHSGYPDSICRVVYQDSQFSWTLENQPKPKGKGWIEAQKIAREVLSGFSNDPTKGALFYHNTSVRPKWSFSFYKVGKIGKHIFYVPKKHIAQKEDIYYDKSIFKPTLASRIRQFTKHVS